jgi:hypothetical protein
MYRKMLFVMVVPVIFLHACKDENPVAMNEKPAISRINLAERWKPAAEDLYKVEASVSDPQGVRDVESVIMNVRRADTEMEVSRDTLYDDGTYLHPGDGDIFAGDGVFSNRFSTNMIDAGITNGSYIFEFTAIDRSGNHSLTEEKSVLFSDNEPPVLANVSAPDTFSVLTPDQLVMVTVIDTNGQDDIQRVYFRSRNIVTGVEKNEGSLFDDGNGLDHGDLKAGDSIYTARLDAGMAVGKKGDFDLIFFADDSFGETGSAGPVRIYIDNHIPDFGLIDVPGTLTRPSPGSSSLFRLITAEVEDPEGLADIDSVYFYSRKPDLSYANNGLPILLLDNGLPFNQNNPGVEVGDTQAGDGIYSFTLILDQTAQLGTYKFSFYVRDRAGNLSAEIILELEVFASD